MFMKDVNFKNKKCIVLKEDALSNSSGICSSEIVMSDRTNFPIDALNNSILKAPKTDNGK